ncbi:MBL fold metallo-hydrolase [Peptoniphilus catoniae]|uniref:MBL fold metallo-hydrolase n=1 Tax=Peptoniphilus catoniae TaxID=1660341 RepID=UPI0010FDDE84|nr:MBL fold metallo-hydrolase [Peptoniphilus catoniae]
MNFKIIRLIVGSYQANCYVVFDEENRAIIIDPGAQSDYIRETIEHRDLKVDKIIVTHAHPDHFGAMEELSKYFKVKTYIGKHENEILKKRSSEIGKEVSADVLVRNGEEISFGENYFKVIKTPGHTPDGMCLLIDNILFSGDTLFRGSIGRTDFEGGDYKTMLNTLKNLMELPEDTLVLPGHGPETTIGDEKATNPFIKGIL